MSDTAEPAVASSNAEANSAAVEPPLVSINKETKPETATKAAPLPGVSGTKFSFSNKFKLNNKKIALKH
jgi:hypothetical protein